MPRTTPNRSQSADLFAEHFNQLRDRYDRLLLANDLEVLAIHAGQVKRHFMDDSEYTFRVNPHFKALCPQSDAAHSWILCRAGQKPTLIFFSAQDYWHSAPDIDHADWLGMFHVELISAPHQVERFLPYDRSRTAYLGEHIEVAQALGIMDVNPEPVVNYLHYHRLFKTDYEIACITEANRIAARGHEAAEAAYYNGLSEFDCWLAYMKATQQGPQNAPYEHIIAHDKHAAILHYRGKSTQIKPLDQRYSMMIDAGASHRGYAADISRTYAFQEGEFAGLIEQVNQLTLDLISWIKPNRTYAALHEQTHLGMANILKDLGWVNMAADDMIEQQVTRAFMPHGFGHMLGLQVHDPGGNMEDAAGKLVLPPERFASLKTTRKIEPRHVITVEPGVYFIDPLLEQLASGPCARYINWRALDNMRIFGGVRIEDNVLIGENENTNLTRQQGFA